MPKPTRYNFSFPIRVAWGEMDAFGHVNNVIFVRYFESARAEYFSSLHIWKTSGTELSQGPVVTHLDMNYRKQVVYPETLDVTMEITSLSSRGFEIHTSMWNQSNECVFTGKADIIWIDFQSGKPTAIPQELRELFPHLTKI